jgi:hypothetical protein
VDGWIKSGRDKLSARRPQIRPNVHHTDQKLKDQNETNRQTDRISQYKKKKCSYKWTNQEVTVILPLASVNRSSVDAGAPSYSSTQDIRLG